MTKGIINQKLFLAASIGFSWLIPQLSQAACGDPATLIASIQGIAAESPVSGEIHTIEAVVTASFQGDDELSGFFIQEELAHEDGDTASSEGLFVFHQDTIVEPGMLVRLSGEVQERFGQTQLASVSEIIVCDSNASHAVKSAEVRLPLESADALEANEGMLVHLKGKLTVTDNFNLGRFGEFVVSNKERLMLPTQVVSPGMDAEVLQNENDLNRLIIDDGNNTQNAEPIVYPSPELSAHNSLRTGQRVKPIVGVLAYAFGNYRIHPTEFVRFDDNNDRPDSPNFDDNHDNRLIVASFNVENYFNGDGLGGSFPTSRGADSYSEFQRQSMKLGRAIGDLGAAIIGIAELENDGYGENNAIASLTGVINTHSYDEYRFINPGMDVLGNDEIAVGMIYQPDKVTPIGAAMTLEEPPFDEFSRQPLAQLFEVNETGMKILVVMNHFKSKGCSGAVDADRDQGDGQGCYNATRVQSAARLTEWLDTISPTPHKVILGDLNSYAQEDPVQTLEDAGYHNLMDDDDDYSYVFEGQAGVLDYALFSKSMRGMVKTVKAWHINADEPRVLDYNEEFKSATQLITLFNDDPYRSSDHDPVYIVIKLKKPHHDDSD
ncbi:MAG: ExeM/NucH family extracellular endonuclease [Gammaproteobacteria bacterium]|nr:ExeM/NucH family extracellular endonuclease [Gammaproteobacteria bacterium]